MTLFTSEKFTRIPAELVATRILASRNFAILLLNVSLYIRLHIFSGIGVIQLNVFHILSSFYKMYPHEGLGGLSPECVLRIPSVIVKGD